MGGWVDLIGCGWIGFGWGGWTDLGVERDVELDVLGQELGDALCLGGWVDG